MCSVCLHVDSSPPPDNFLFKKESIFVKFPCWTISGATGTVTSKNYGMDTWCRIVDSAWNRSAFFLMAEISQKYSKIHSFAWKTRFVWEWERFCKCLKGQPRRCRSWGWRLSSCWDFFFAGVRARAGDVSCKSIWFDGTFTLSAFLFLEHAHAPCTDTA